MSEVNYFRACWAGSAYRNEQFIPDNRWKRVTGKCLHEPVLSVSTRLVNVSQFRKQFRSSYPLGQTFFLCASTLKQLSVFLKERPTENLKELAKVAQQYISAHQCQLAHTSNRDTMKVNPDKGEVDKNMKCFNCNCLGHKAMDYSSLF